MIKAKEFLNKLNNEYFKLHQNYEKLFWDSYMGDRSADVRKDKALAKLDMFRGSDKFLIQAKELQASTENKKLKVRLQYWIDYFSLSQVPAEAKILKEKISELETKILKGRNERKTGYIDPFTNKIVEASELKMRTMTRTNPEEEVRKACFNALENLATDFIDEYVDLVKLRNEFARLLGFTDFYDYKLQTVDRMSKKELFGLFDDITEKTKGMFDEVRKLEKETKGLRKPWNFLYYMAGDFTKEEDPYFQFDHGLLRWGRSFAALDIDFRGGKLKLDLLDRSGKWNNAFCHWPELVHYDGSKRIAGSSNFTCNVVVGQVGSGVIGQLHFFMKVVTRRTF